MVNDCTKPEVLAPSDKQIFVFQIWRFVCTNAGILNAQGTCHIIFVNIILQPFPVFLPFVFKFSFPAAFPFHRIAYHSFFLCLLRLNREHAAVSLALYQSRSESSTLPLIELVSVRKLRCWKTWQRKIGNQFNYDLTNYQLSPNAPQWTFSRDGQSDRLKALKYRTLWNFGGQDRQYSRTLVVICTQYSILW
jgi:hypothetical protein